MSSAPRRALSTPTSSGASLSRPSPSLPSTTSHLAGSTVPASSSTTAAASSTAAPPASLAATTASPSASSAPSEASHSAGATLVTHLTPWSSTLGGILVLSGTCTGAAAAQLPRASFAIAGLYSGALVVSLVLLDYAVAPKLEPPLQTACGLYLLASVDCGLVAAIPCALFPIPSSALSPASPPPSSSSRLGPTPSLAQSACATSSSSASSRSASSSSRSSASSRTPSSPAPVRSARSSSSSASTALRLVFIVMAIQSRFLSIFVRRDAEAKRTQRDEAAREDQLARANRRRSRVELNDWEEKYGPGATSSGASDEQTLTGVGGDIDKVRSTGSMASLLPPGARQPTPSGSIDFLPKLGVYPPSAALSSPPIDDFGRPPARPVLASIQPSQRNVKPEWNSYMSTRKVAVAEPKPPAPPKRASRTLSLFSIGRRGSERAPSVKVHAVDDRVAAVPVEDDDDDDVPLAAVRSLSTGALPRPSTMYDLTSASAPNLSRPANGSGTSLAPPPRSRSRMSLAVPAVLAAPPPAASPPLSVSPQRPATLARVGLGRSSTLLDLTAPSTFDPYHDRARQVKHEASRGPERIAVGERRRVQSTPMQVEQETAKGKGKAVDIGGGARIMDFGDLEDKHRKRLSTLQSTANDKLTSSAALARFQAEQRAEAEAQRKREARRSVDSNLHLLGAGARRAASPDPAQARATRKRASASMGSLSGSLKRGAPSSPPEPQLDERRARTTSTSIEREREEDVPLGALRREHSSSTSLALARPERPRRASTQALVSQQQPSQQVARPSAASVRPSAQRRHSLGTLLEVSSSRDDGAPATVPVPHHGPPATSARVDKVAAWRRSGSVGGGALTLTAGVREPAAVAAAGVGEAALLQRVADKAAPKKKHDWLQY